MPAEDVEAIRQRLMSLLVDAEAVRRKVRELDGGKGAKTPDAFAALTQIADRIDRETRELYHLLPEHLRPAGTPRPQAPHEPALEGRNGRRHHGPKPGGPIPREVRWPDWTIEQILALIDAYRAKHGKWPTKNSGPISDSSPDTWNGIDIALDNGNRNLPGGTSLARLIAEYRGVRNRTNTPKLTIEMILVWIDEEYARSQAWPNANTGPVVGAPGETWRGIDRALRRQQRGLTVKSSLPQLLAEKRGVIYVGNRPTLTVAKILAWADAYYRRTGRWPICKKDVIPEAPHETWATVNEALIHGAGGLPGGSSLARLLAEHRGVRNRKALPPFDIETILQWADAHYARHGRWPTFWSKAVEDAPGETWPAIDAAFKSGGRGLKGCGYRSLAHLLDERRGKLRHRGNRPGERNPPPA